MKGYKVFNPDWTCRGFKYEVGETYEHDGNIELCGAGFHFCREASDCFSYYDFKAANKVAEIEAIGLIESDDKKSVTNKIKIVREIPWNEVLSMVNVGSNCTGLGSSGNWNSCNWSSGNWNSCNWSSGNWNSCNWISGDSNSGLWIYSKNMSAEEKAAHPEHETTGGYLKVVPYKEACRIMWNKLTNEERTEVQKIPNFNADIFEDITGIRV